MQASKRVLVLILMSALQSCASLNSQKDRMLAGAGTGAALGVGGGILLSPNDESRGLNGLVFGLSGALIGGAIGYITTPAEKPTQTAKTLEERELANVPQAKEYVVSPQGELPNFLKNRMSPAVVEEFVEQDSVSEDGSLHEPHKVYRIKRAAELISRPENTTGVKQ